MRILVIDDNYPSADNLYGDVFAHVRVKEYLNEFPEILVAASLSTAKPSYTYEGVSVQCVGSIENLVQLVNDFQPSIVLIHFATFPIIRKVIFQFDLPYLIWVHGFEALGWYRRLFNFKDPIHFLRYIKGNAVQLFYFRKLIALANRNKKIHLIFVSDWMRKIAETDCSIKVKRYSLIPNPINDALFTPLQKTADDRTKLLMIRPFGSKKYGTDIVTEAMQLLRTKPFFNHLHFTIYGSGSTSSSLYKLFHKEKNVVIKEGFLKQSEIKSLHQEHGVFLTVTRQDAQGVSMCEAMCSGLVPITSNNTAIPEFVTNNISGILTDNKPESVANAIEELYYNPDKFLSISKAASHSIIEKAGIKNVIEKEIQLMQELSTIHQ